VFGIFVYTISSNSKLMLGVWYCRVYDFNKLKAYVVGDKVEYREVCHINLIV